MELLNRSCCVKCYGPNFDFIFEQEVGWWLFVDAEPLKFGFRRKGATECSSGYSSYMYMPKYQLPRGMSSVLSNKHVIPKLPGTFVLIEIHLFLCPLHQHGAI